MVQENDPNSRIAELYLQDILKSLTSLKTQAEKAVAQIRSEEDLFWLPDGESNSIALLIKHITGNMRSRWTDFLTSDGEKPDRNRPSEFDQSFSESRSDLMDRWEIGWQLVFDAIRPLTTKNLEQTVYIRGEAHTVLQAINRQLLHYSGHIAQIIFLAKHIQNENWNSLSIPREK
ncbi:MAG: DUF1572 family protein [Candidatus Kariarchaeaceae archaeon]|jgi:hypothetical protein